MRPVLSPNVDLLVADPILGHREPEDTPSKAMLAG